MKNWLLLLPFFITSCFSKPPVAPTWEHDRAILPDDEALHPQNPLEWWYYTGHFTTSTGEEVGMEFVFFHFNPYGKKDWLMSNVAITLPERNEFVHDYVLSSFKNDALTSQLPIQLALTRKKKKVRMEGQEGAYQLEAAYIDERDIHLQMDLTPTEGVILHEGTGIATYGTLAKAGYYSYPSLEARGTIELEGEKLEIQGSVWYDRQWNCSGVMQKEVGWDWMAIQLDNDTDIMLYALRLIEQDSVITGGTIVKDGEQITLDSLENHWQPMKWWASDKSKARYPVSWQIQIPDLEIDLMVDAAIDHQELSITFAPFVKLHYWEGMCKVSGEMENRKVNGKAYLEMTNR